MCSVHRNICFIYKLYNSLLSKIALYTQKMYISVGYIRNTLGAKPGYL